MVGEKKEKKTSLFVETFLNTVKNPGARVGLIIFLVIAIVCFLSPLIAPYDYNEMDMTQMFQGPSIKHWFGTDKFGRDIFSRMMYGGRYSIIMGLCAAIFGSAIGIVIGSISGYFGGTVETVIMRIMDIWSSIPGILLCIMISTVMGPGFFNTVFALSIGGVPGGVRMIRGQILAERSKEYLEAAESINCSKLSIMFKHMLPNVISPTIVQTTMQIGQTISMAATLSYIGLGVQPPTPEWGAMLSDGRGYILTYPYMIMFPGIVIAVTVLAINLIGDGLRDALDPKLRK